MKSHTEKEDQELAALVQMRDEDIDTSDIPEVRDWSKAVVGKFYRPIKEPVSLRLDADVLAWLKSEGPGYQTRINTVLREAMTAGSYKKTAEASLEVVDLRFPSLENHGELEKCNYVAELIERRHCLFAASG